MDATRYLSDEHDLIQQVLLRLDDLLARTRRTGEVRRDKFEPFLEFLSDFVLTVHFFKEEHALFPLLYDHGAPQDGGPLAALANEHAAIESLVRDFRNALAATNLAEPSATEAVLCKGAGLIEMVRAHAQREDHCMLTMASALLRDADPAEVERVFVSAERQVADSETLARLNRLGLELARD